MSVLLWCVLVDELVLAYAQSFDRLSKVMACVLVAVVGTKPQLGTIWPFGSDGICDRFDCHMPCCISVKLIRYPLACIAVYDVKAVTPAVCPAPNIRYVRLPQLVRCLWFEEFAPRADYIIFCILWPYVAYFTIDSGSRTNSGQITCSTVCGMSLLLIMIIYPRHLQQHCHLLW